MLHYLFPQFCSICKTTIKKNKPLCPSCLNEITANSKLEFFKKNILCHSGYPYSNHIKTLIKELKFNQKLAHSYLLGTLIKEQIKNHYQRLPELIIPIPLHKKRLQQRGFNQSLEVAKVISKTLHIPIDKHSIIRKKATEPQAQLSAYQRKLNIRNAFSLKKDIDCNKHIILFDDVITTGETIYSCYRLLKKYGLKKIDVWSIARPIV